MEIASIDLEILAETTLAGARAAIISLPESPNRRCDNLSNDMVSEVIQGYGADLVMIVGGEPLAHDPPVPCRVLAAARKASPD